MSRTVSSLTLAASLLATGHAMAESPMLWHGESLTYLYGQNFRIDPAIQQTVTFEHASNWTWGDVFLFVDSIWFNSGATDSDGNHGFYGEFSPRLSFGKLSGTDLSFGPISDVLLAATLEYDQNDGSGTRDNRNYLIGPGFDLKIPGFDYFQVNIYYRKPDGTTTPSGAWQVTPAWSYTIPVGRSDILIDGYMDWVVNNKGDYHANLHFNPQVSYDLGKALNLEAKHLYVGFEYDYWKNKYGIKDGGYVSENFVGTTDQNTASLMVKYHF
ncbi:nucleoside-specific outer membrane channel protein Tsx [Pseudomonas duriflava]|uniref:Nucleoside-specific outer membrane channel protein Tsx n=1 Tax=Pseudomonas duriflava TaxID=459528 RepID=A0A562Q6Z0_9PSED|nr:outer membrane protein OmpK [Pseudomonas duriflava]TWI52531.1 nucleoside-specific outer membrane channel protein Tsx [Pseudomonas duriflava]